MAADKVQGKEKRQAQKTRNGHEKDTKDTHRNWAEYLRKVIRELGWTHDRTIEELGIEIGWLKKALNGLEIRGEIRRSVESRLSAKWMHQCSHLPPLAWPAWIDDAPWAAGNISSYHEPSSAEGGVSSTPAQAGGSDEIAGTGIDFSTLSKIERQVLGLFAAAGPTLSIAYLASKLLDPVSYDDALGACRALQTRALVTLSDDTATLCAAANSLRETIANVLAKEIESGYFDLLDSVLFPFRPLPIRDIDRGDSLFTRLLSLLRPRLGDVPRLERHLHDLLGALKPDASFAGANLLEVVAGAKGELSGFEVPPCTLRRPNFRGVLAPGVDLRACRMVDPQFTTSLRNISCLELGPEPETLFLGDSTGNIALASWSDGNLRWRYPLHTQWVRHIVLSGRWTRGFSCGEDGRVCYFTLKGEVVGTVETGRSCWELCLSDDEEILAVVADAGQVCLLRAASTDSPRVMLSIGTSRLRAIAWDREHEVFVLGGDDGALYELDRDGHPSILLQLPSGIRSIVYAGAGSLLVGGQDGKVRHVSERRLGREYDFHQAEVRSLALRPGGFLSASRDGSVAFWRFDSPDPNIVWTGFDGGVRRTVDSDRFVGVCFKNHALILDWNRTPLGEVAGILDETWGAAVAEGGEVAVGLENGEIRIAAPVPDLTEITRFVAHERRIRSLAISPDRSRMATGSSDRSVRLWNRLDDRWSLDQALPIQLTGVRALRFYGGNRWLLVGSDDGQIRVWDCRRRTWGRPVFAHDAEVLGLVTLEGSNRLATISKDHSLAVSDFRQRNVLARLRFEATPSALTSDESESLLYVGLETGGIVAVRDPEQVEYLRGVRDGASVQSLAWASGAKRLVAATRDGFLCAYQIEDGSVQRRVELPAHEGGCNAVVAIENTSLVVSTGADGSIALWSADELRLISRLRTSFPYNKLRFNSSSVSSAIATDLERLGALRE